MGQCYSSSGCDCDTSHPPHHHHCPGHHHHHHHHGRHHSLCVQQQAASLSHSGLSAVYRPPQVNHRIAPGESRPRFWINPQCAGSQEPAAVVSVAWCEACTSYGGKHHNSSSGDVMTSVDSSTRRHRDREGGGGGKTSRWDWCNIPPSVKYGPSMGVNKAHDNNVSPSTNTMVVSANCRKTAMSKQDGGEMRTSNKEDTGDDLMMVATTTAAAAGDHNNMMVKAYPRFLLPYVNHVVRLRLEFADTKALAEIGAHNHLKHDLDLGSDGRTGGGCQGHMTETSQLVRTVHSLRLHLKYSSVVRGLPEVTLDENHGGSKKYKKLRYRHMPVRWIDLDHRNPSLFVAGESFKLSLTPPCPLMTSHDFPDGNGEVPSVVGTYSRHLDTCPGQQLHFHVRLFQWYNNTS